MAMTKTKARVPAVFKRVAHAAGHPFRKRKFPSDAALPNTQVCKSKTWGSAHPLPSESILPWQRWNLGGKTRLDAFVPCVSRGGELLNTAKKRAALHAHEKVLKEDLRMSVMDTLLEIRQKASEELESSASPPSWKRCAFGCWGKKGDLTALLKGLGQLSPQERPPWARR